MMLMGRKCGEESSYGVTLLDESLTVEAGSATITTPSVCSKACSGIDPPSSTRIGDGASTHMLWYGS